MQNFSKRHKSASPITDKSRSGVCQKKAVETATGEYLVFIDADDYIEKTYFERLMAIAEEADMITAGYFRGEDTTCPIFDLLNAGFYHTKEQMDHIIDNMIIFACGPERGITPYIWNKLFRMDLARQVFSEINVNVFIGEDSEFIYRYLLKCDSVKISDICGYHYCDREGSIVNSKHDNYLTNLNELYLSLKKVFENHRKRFSYTAITDMDKHGYL